MSNWPTTQHLLMPTRCVVALDEIRSALNDRTDAIDMVETIYGIAYRALRPDPPKAASADTRPEGGDGTKIAAPFTSGAVPSETSADAQRTPDE